MYIKLKQLRHKKGYTTRDMSEKIGISKAFYCQIENNKRNLSYRMAVRIAEVFKMKPDALFYDDFKETMDEQ